MMCNLRLIFLGSIGYAVISVKTGHSEVNLARSESLPSEKSKLDIRQGPLINCVDGVYNADCWYHLDLTNWLNAWYLDTPICEESRNLDTRHCRLEGEPWTTAFLRIAQNDTGGSGCTKLNACLDNPPNLEDVIFSNATEAAQYRYVCYNIYGSSI